MNTAEQDETLLVVPTVSTWFYPMAAISGPACSPGMPDLCLAHSMEMSSYLFILNSYSTLALNFQLKISLGNRQYRF